MAGVRLRLGVYAFIAAASASCGLFFSVDGYVGPSNDGGIGGDAGPGDGRSPADADASVDVVPDGMDARSTEGGGFCTGYPNALFCDDFDEGPFGAKWDATVPSSWTFATLSLSDAQALSPPYSMLAQVLPDDSGAMNWAFAMLGASAGPVPAKLRASFDLYVDTLVNHSAEIPFVGLEDGVNEYTFYLFVRPDGVVFFDEDLLDGGTSQYTIGQTPSLVGSWTRAILELDLGASPTFTLTMQQPPGNAVPPVAKSVPISFGTATLVLPTAGLYGIFTNGTQCAYYVDNVLLEAE
jgi:hypothetical protein